MERKTPKKSIRNGLSGTKKETEMYSITDMNMADRKLNLSAIFIIGIYERLVSFEVFLFREGD